MLVRFASRVRVVLLLLYAGLVVFSAPAEQVPAAIAVALLLVVWSFAVLAAPAGGPVAFAVDAVAISAVCLSPSWSGLPDGIGWILAVGGLTAIGTQYSWALRPALGIGIAAVSAAAYVAGNLLLGHDPLPAVLLGARLFAEGLLARVSYLLIRGYARTADRLAARAAARRQDAEVARARRRAEREYLATLHDTASATLLMIATSGGRSAAEVAERAQQDLATLNAAPGPPAGRADLAELLRDVVREQRIHVDLRLPDVLELPEQAAGAVAKGVREALSNVARHAGVDRAELRAEGDERGGVEVVLADRGTGFDPGRVRAGARGLDGSITGRMRAAGGSAEVRSAPGTGTEVRWRWRPAEPERDSRDGARVRSRLVSGMRMALLLVALLVQTCFCAAQLTGYAGFYRALWPEVLAFGLLLAVGLADGWWVLRGRRRPRWWPRVALVCVAAGAVLGTAAVPPEHLFRTAHWSFGLVGWYGLLLLFDRPPGHLLRFFAGCVVLTAAPLLAAGPSREAVAMMVVLTVSVHGYQLAVGLIGQRLSSIAAVAERTAAEEEDLRTAEVIADALHRDRRERYAALRRTTAPLLAELASGRLDPADPEVRRRCALEAARVRRLLVADAEDQPDLLLHELRACVDVVQRAGAPVELAVRGAPLELPAEVRRAITDVVLAVLAQVRARARVTLLRTADEVRVGVIGDAPASVALPGARPEVHVSKLAKGEDLWVSAKTTAGRSRSR